MDPVELNRIAGWCAKWVAKRRRLQPADRDDIRSDVLVALLAAIPTHRPELSPLDAFLFLVGRWAAIRAMRRVMRDRGRADQWPDLVELTTDGDTRHVDDADEAAWLLDALTPLQRDVVVRCLMNGEEQKAYSSAAGRFKTMAANNLRLALGKMRRRAGVHGPEADDAQAA